MSFFLGLSLLSFLINFVTLIPFINFLYKCRLQRRVQRTKDALNHPTPLFDKYNHHKAGTPIGGGLLVVINTTLLFFFSFPVLYYFWIPITSIYRNISSEIKILIFTFLSFTLLGFYDDLKKIFLYKSDQFFGLRLRHKLVLEIVLSFLIAFWLFTDLKIDMIYIPFFRVVHLGYFYIPFAAFVITAFANAYNITDGMDGLAAGILMIALVAFWVISHAILDTPLSLFISIWLGALIAFLYFNIYPARIFLGDVGALTFGATFAVIGLMLGKAFSLVIIGGLFVIEVFSSLIQLLGKKFLGRKIVKVAPLHLWLQVKGWHESTVIFRAWLISIFLAIVGLWLAFLS
uniref:Phospho-N-acetylmuramoyl-pentapeptide-transferase n=1 Tax=candidate division CPR3 bacterium TaxID=2268181 RepID=A0A7C4M3C7_UNCC3